MCWWEFILHNLLLCLCVMHKQLFILDISINCQKCQIRMIQNQRLCQAINQQLWKQNILHLYFFWVFNLNVRKVHWFVSQIFKRTVQIIKISVAQFWNLITSIMIEKLQTFDSKNLVTENKCTVWPKSGRRIVIGRSQFPRFLNFNKIHFPAKLSLVDYESAVCFSIDLFLACLHL